MDIFIILNTIVLIASAIALITFGLIIAIGSFKESSTFGIIIASIVLPVVALLVGFIYDTLTNATTTRDFVNQILSEV